MACNTHVYDCNFKHFKVQWQEKLNDLTFEKINSCNKNNNKNVTVYKIVSYLKLIKYLIHLQNVFSESSIKRRAGTLGQKLTWSKWSSL